MAKAGQHGLIERAFELAKSGECSGSGELRRRLEAEGFTGVAMLLAAAPTLNRTLSKLCLEAQGISSRSPFPDGGWIEVRGQKLGFNGSAHKGVHGRLVGT